MWNTTPLTYKGFEIYVLWFPRSTEPRKSTGNRDTGCVAAVRICRQGVTPDRSNSHVFALTGKHFEQTGEARRTAGKYGESIIDGDVKGQSVEDL